MESQSHNAEFKNNPENFYQSISTENEDTHMKTD